MISVQQAINDLKKLPKGTKIDSMELEIKANTQEDFSAVADAMDTIKHEGVSILLRGPIRK